MLPHLLLVALIVVWSASFAVSKAAQQQLGPFGLVALRFWLAVMCLTLCVRGDAAAQLRAAMRPGLFAGIALSAGYLLQMTGLRETTASMSGLLAGLIVPIVAVGGFVFFHARIGTRGLLGLVLAIAGMVVVCLPSDDQGTDTLRGILLQVGSSASYAVHVLLLSRFGQRVPIVAFTLIQMVTVAVAGTVATLLTGDFAARPELGIEWTPALLAQVAYLGIVATAIAVGLQGRVQHQIPPTHVALLFTLQPLFAALIGWGLGDRLSALQLLGGGLIVLGVVVTSLDRAPNPPQ